MIIVTCTTTQQYMEKLPDSDIALRSWYKVTKNSEWNNFGDVKQTFNSVDNIGNNRFVFNVKGNKYRIIAIIIFASKKVYVRFIGTYNEYDKIKDCSTI
jgi:mRNA interferase HigB